MLIDYLLLHVLPNLLDNGDDSGDSGDSTDPSYSSDGEFGSSYEHPYSLGQYVANDGILGGFLNFLWGGLTGRNNANESAAMTFKHDQDMLELQRQYYEQGLLEDPSLSMQGMTNAGINPNAIAHGLSGSSGGYSPSASSNSAPMANNALPALLSTLLSQPLIQAQAKNQIAQANRTNEETSWMPRLNAQQIQESQSRIYNTFERLDIDRKYLGMAELLNKSLLGKTQVECQQITKQCQLLDQDIQKAIVETKLLERYSTHELIKMSYTKSQINKTYADTEVARATAGNIRQDTELKQQQIVESQSRVGVNEATTANLRSQTQGQDIQNDIADVERTMQEFRLRCSQVLHCDVNASEATMLLEASLNNQAGQVAEAVESSHNGFFGSLSRLGHSFTSRNRRSNLKGTLQRHLY